MAKVSTSNLSQKQINEHKEAIKKKKELEEKAKKERLRYRQWVVERMTRLVNDVGRTCMFFPDADGPHRSIVFEEAEARELVTLTIDKSASDLIPVYVSL
mmetsp:Transcript_31002/g.81406  ORF Transcript_31002/g.81406 Transcript_31002/m.81406 type:complete len:100 (+) Transcript_31002:468-767(+)